MRNIRLTSLVAVVLLMVIMACGSKADPEPAVIEPTLAPATATGVPTPTVSAELERAVATLESPATVTPASTSTPLAAGELEEKIVDDATLLRLGPEPPTLDPHLTADAESAIYILEMFGGLVTINRDLEIAGDLAEDWDISNEGRTYTFRLRKNAKFHDGKPVTAQDFKWSLERIADPATGSLLAATMLGDIAGFNDKLNGLSTQVEGVQVLDDHTLSITINAPRAYFLAKLTHPAAFVLDSDNVEGNPDWIDNPNGTGPFKLREYIIGEVLRLTRNELYHLGPPKLGGVRFLLSGGDSLLMYQNDEIHVTGVGLTGLEIILDPSSPLKQEVYQAPPLFDIAYFGMNVDQPPFDDLKVRQALNHSVDKERLSTVLLQGLVTPANGILPPGFPAYTTDLRGYSFEPEKAKQLLRESKYGDDLDDFPLITLTLPGSFGAPVSPIIQAMVQMWQDNLGIEIGIAQTAWPVFLEDLKQKRFQMFGGLAWIADYLDPENFLDVLFHSESENNYSKYSNPQVDRLLEQARGELNEAARFEIYHQVEQQILDDAAWVPLWHETGGYLLLKPNVKDYYNFPMAVSRFRYVYITEE